MCWELGVGSWECPFRRALDGITLATHAGVRWCVLLLIALLCLACQGQSAKLDDAQQSVDSVRATATTVVRGWLAGDLSDQFAGAAIERAYELSEQTRTDLTASPRLLADRRAASLTEDCEQLSRLLARLGASIHRGDHAAAQTALADIGAHAEPSTRATSGDAP